MRKFLTLLLLLAPSLYAANGLTTAAISSTESHFNQIELTCPYTGDDNGDASALVEFSVTGSGTWKSAYTPTIDRRATIGTFANPFVKQARVVIFWLTENTSYDLRVTWTDPDGVSGTNPRTATVVTRTKTPPTPGTVVWVDASNSGSEDGSSAHPYNTIAEGESAVAAGGIVKIMPGTYAVALTTTKSGNSSNWIKWEAQSGGNVTIGAGSVGLTNSGSYRWFKGIRFAQTATHGAEMTGSADYIYFDTCAWPEAPSTNSYGFSCIYTGSSSVGHLWVRASTFNRSAAAGDGDGHGTHFAVYFNTAGSVGGHLFEDNTITGTFRDGIACGGQGFSQSFGPNVGFVRNNVSGVQDDAMEVEGLGINTFAVGNTFEADVSQGNVVGSAGTGVGPLYFIRNIIRSTTGRAGVKQGNTDYGPEYWFHNTFYITGGSQGDGFSELGGSPFSDYLICRNNIFQVSRHCYYRMGLSGSGGSGNWRHPDLDYNDFVTGFSSIANEWNTSTSYATLAAFRTGTGFETHGVNDTSSPYNAPTTRNYTLKSTALARNAGVVLANINDSSSDQPYQGAAPDMGAFEYAESGGDVTPPTVSSRSIPSAGTTIVLPMSEVVTGTTGFTVSATAGAVTVSSVSGGSTSTLTLNLSRTIYNNETVTLSYAPGNVQDTAGNALASFSGAAVTNGSSQPPPDTTAPTPNPMTFSSAPAAGGSTFISMTASTATDASTPPVEYFFNNTTVVGHDSGWQSSASWTDTGLSANTSYTYRVKARDAVATPNETAYSSTSATSTLALPGTPTSLIATAIGPNQIDLAWTDAATGETAYEVFRSTSSGFTPGAGNLQMTLAANSTSYTDTIVEPSTTYYYKVRCYRNPTPDYSAASSQASATTPAVTPPNPPTNPLLMNNHRTRANP